MSNYNAFAKALILAVLAIIVVIFSIEPQFAPIKSTLKLPDVMGALGGVFIIVLLVERVTEIVITIWRQSESESIKSEIESIGKDLAKTPDGIKSLDLQEKNKSLATYQSNTKSIALLVGFSISVIVCAAGVGLLDVVLDTATGNKSFLRAVDIILTSGLIAGGSDSFHQFVSTLETFFNQSKKQMEK